MRMLQSKATYAKLTFICCVKVYYNIVEKPSGDELMLHKLYVKIRSIMSSNLLVTTTIDKTYTGRRTSIKIIF